MSLELLRAEPAVDRARERLSGAAALQCGCPACGPLAASATSRYCARHLRQMRDAWLAGRPRDWRPAA
jgi:hypothetical protein